MFAVDFSYEFILFQAPSTYRGAFDAATTIWMQRGPAGFFRGVQARVLYQMPATALSWSVYELFKFALSIEGGHSQ